MSSFRHSSASAYSPASLGGRVWGGCFQSGIPALPFIGGQPLPPRLTRVGSFGAVVPQPTAGFRAVGSPFRAKFPPEVRFFVAGNAVTVGNTSKLVLQPEPKQGI